MVTTRSRPTPPATARLRRSRHGSHELAALSLPARARTSLTGGVLAVIAALSGLAAGIHLTVAPEHFDEWWGYGTFFLVAAAGECALVLLRRCDHARGSSR